VVITVVKKFQFRIVVAVVIKGQFRMVSTVAKKGKFLGGCYGGLKQPA